jgi:hypothetical protein
MGIEKHPVFEDINTLLKSLGYFLLNPVFKNDTEIARYLMNAPYEAQMIDEEYIDAMEHGMPPTGGFGVGLTTVSVPTITATQRVYSDSTYSNNNYPH